MIQKKQTVIQVVMKVSNDPLSQPHPTPKLRNLKWVSKFDKPTGKCGFTGQPGINAAGNDVNDSLELFKLSQMNLLTSL